MKVELKKLELTNYRNIPHAIFEFDGNSKIVGENRIGKTNTLEAIIWLLTDKLLNGSSDIAQIKSLSDTKSEVRVEGTFLVGDKTIVIRKEYGEDWVKVRSTEQVVFKGHYLTYYYNGVKQKTQKDFYAMFFEDFGIDTNSKIVDLVQLLTNPFYIGDMGETDKWKDLRTFIISLIGDVSDDDVFAKNEKFLTIKNDLSQRMGRIDETKKYYQGQINGLEEQIIGLDAQVKMLEETPTPNESDVAIAKKGIEDLDADINRLQLSKGSDSACFEIEKEIQSKQGQILELKKKDLALVPGTQERAKLTELNAQYHDLLSNKAVLNEKIRENQSNIERTKKIVEECNEKRTQYIASLREIDKLMQEPFDAVCPLCSRPLEGDALEKAKENHLKSFIEKKDAILKEGKLNKEKKELNETVIKNLEENAKNLDNELQSLKSDIDACLKAIDETNAALKEIENQPIVANPLIEELENEIKELEQKKRIIQVDLKAANVEINEKIQEKMAEKEKFNKVLADLAYYERTQTRLSTVKATRKDCSDKLVQFEQKKELLNVFIKTKLEMLDENVARVFGNIKFQLIKENINGGFDPICKPYIYDVDKEESTTVSWKSGSKSERVITGIAICEKIKDALGLADLPFLFDEGGEISTDSFNTKFKTNSQLICVKVMDNIKTPMVMKI